MWGEVAVLASARARPRAGESSPALTDLLETFVPAGSRCLNVGRGNRLAMRTWLAGHGCRPVDVAPRQATELAFEDESFDAALLIGVLDQLEDVGRAAAELRRVLRPGGVLLVNAANRSYLAGRRWRRSGSAPYRAAERLFPALLGSQVGAFAIKV
jgi:SAM-dependent methyltransferase